jgi:Protein of unknown function (DUF3379)
MTDCERYRRTILADPRSEDAEMRVHLASCPDCTEYTEQLRRFENRLDRALRVDLGAERRDDRSVIPLRPSKPLRAGQLRRVPRGWLAAAASVLLAVVVAGSLWLAVPGPSLAADVVSHMAEEPEAWARTNIPVPQPRLDTVMSASHVRLKGDPGLVSYANSCQFRGHLVPHLVVQTEAGPVTVMVLAHEASRSSSRFNEHGYQGVIVPVPGHGSLAVLERGTGIDLDTVKSVAERVRGAIVWTD